MKRSSDNTPLTAIDLFAGCGGLTEGLKRAGFKVVGAVEVDPSAAKVYRRNHKATHMFERDIRQLDPHVAMQDLKLKSGQLDLLAGCPPCQGFSSLRTRNGAKRNRDFRNELLFEMIRFARAFAPRAIMLENVPMLAVHSMFRTVIKQLQELKYNVEFQIANAADFGVAQRRKRLILLATKGFVPAFAVAEKKRFTVRDAIGHMPPPNSTKDKLHTSDMSRRSDRVLQIIKSIPKNGGSRNSLPKRLRLDCHKRKSGFNDVYGRMAWEAVAPTITGGCYNPSKGRFLHPQANRPITLREAALLQGFRKTYFFDASLSLQSTALMIGNALPPPFIKHHAKALAKQIRAQ